MSVPTVSSEVDALGTEAIEVRGVNFRRPVPGSAVEAHVSPAQILQRNGVVLRKARRQGLTFHTHARGNVRTTQTAVK